MQIRNSLQTEGTEAALTKEEFEAFKLNAVSCDRVSHYPAQSWYLLGGEIGRSGNDSYVYTCSNRVVLTADQTPYYKLLSTPYVVKIRKIFEWDEASRFFQNSELGLRVPFAKVKPPTMVGLRDGSYQITIVMGKIEGKTMAKLLFLDDDCKYQRTLDIPTLERLQIMLEAAFSVEEIHISGIVHRDISPANVMVKRGNYPIVNVLDFDFAKLVEDEAAEEGCGTPLFMSAEACRGENTTFKTDVRGLAWLFFLLLDGKFPRMDNRCDVYKYANNFEVTAEKLFSVIRNGLLSHEKTILVDLLNRMFARDQENRCELKDCITTLEHILLERKIAFYPADQRGKMRAAFLLGKRLRLYLVEVAFNSTLLDNSPDGVFAAFNQALDRLPNLPDALPLFLSTLRIKALMSFTSVSEIKNAVQKIITCSEANIEEFKSFREDIPRLINFLESQGAVIVSELKSQRGKVDYLFMRYENFFWSLDNLVLVDRKLVKSLEALRPIVEKARQEQEAIKKTNPPVTGWPRFMSSPRVLSSPPSNEGQVLQAAPRHDGSW